MDNTNEDMNLESENPKTENPKTENLKVDNPKTENPLGMNPFGENPLGEGFIGDSSFGRYSDGNDADGSDDGSGGEKVCPNCGTGMAEGETYCMACGMSVIPVHKRDYDKAINHDDSQGAKGAVNSYNDPYGRGNMSRSDPYGRGGTRSGVGTGSRSRSASNGSNLWIVIIMIVAFVFAVFFLIKGIGASKEEKMTVMSRHVISPIADRVETFTLYATGDTMTRLTFETVIDVSGRDQRAIDATIEKARQQYAEQDAQIFIDVDIRQEGNQLIIMLDYKNLNITSNVDYLLEKGVLEVEGGKDAIKRSKVVSYRVMVDKLKQQQYRAQ